MRCIACGYQGPRFVDGICPQCGGETGIDPDARAPAAYAGKAKRLDAVSAAPRARVKTTKDVDRATGGGWPLPSCYVVSGVAGAGKSTGALKWASAVARATKRPALILSAEMDEQLVRAMATRLELPLEDLMVLAGDDLEIGAAEAEAIKPSAVIVDSVSRFRVGKGACGTDRSIVDVVQASCLIAVSARAVVWAIAHATKDGAIKGPSDAAHDVDGTIWVDDGLATVEKNRWGETPAECRVREP